jgi:hypothetical protein
VNEDLSLLLLRAHLGLLIVRLRDDRAMTWQPEPPGLVERIKRRLR